MLFNSVLVLCILSVGGGVAQLQGLYETGQGLCLGQSRCTRISECGLLNDLVHRSCLAADRFKSLACGYYGTEPMLCCPTGGRHSLESLVSRGSAAAWTELGTNSRGCGVPRIRGALGTTELGAQPWVARIGFLNTVTGETKYPCGGSILGNTVILTAAHCALAKADNYKLNSVLVGEWATHTTPDCGAEFCALPPQHMAVSHVVVHPGYQPDGSYRHDVALIFLKNEINYTVTAQPICIFNEKHKLFGTHATLVGWGKLAGQQAQPSLQQSLTLNVVDMNRCRRSYAATGVQLGDEGEQLCVGGNDGQDACAGFGGAPLVAKHLANGVYHQIGLLSFGSEQCGSPGVPSVYINVNHYAAWIRENAQILYN